MKTREIEGVNELIRKLQDFSQREIPLVLRQALRAGAKVIQQEVKLRAPVDTGLLEENITVRAVKHKAGRVGYRVTIKPNDEFVKVTTSGKRYFYPAIVEYGAESKNIEAQHFMRDAFDVKADEALAVVARELKAGVEHGHRAAADPETTE